MSALHFDRQQSSSTLVNRIMAFLEAYKTYPQRSEEPPSQVPRGSNLYPPSHLTTITSFSTYPFALDSTVAVAVAASTTTTTTSSFSSSFSSSRSTTTPPQSGGGGGGGGDSGGV
ncbi:hypothetical protein Cni_G00973 [Canna indica]|uniref:Uncharacterized protein n=1 Tax=Canna indica TaxID=4628 RepID=A0AAQ3JNK7_9LILI|nr:hypothetical protein Cni_G00973 [Canna indica]